MLSASLVKDINTTYADANPANFLTSVGELYFNANDGINGQPLWQTDGTAAGTKLAVSLVPGAPQATMSDFSVANGSVYFFAQGPTDGNQIGLYKSAGSAATTTELGAFTQPGNLTNFNGTLYFSSLNPSGGEEIWISHGTASTTTPLVAASSVAFLTDADGELFFLDQTTLWKSDGTQAGTMAVANMANTAGTVQIQSVVAVNSRVYVLDSGELWTSDGTTAGTQQIPDSYEVAAIASYEGALYYTVFSYTDQLWETGGASAGTLVFSQAHPNFRGESGAMAVANNTLYFNLGDTSHGEELYKSDGSGQGTSLVADVNPGPSDGVSIPYPSTTLYGPTIAGMGVLNGVVYFPGTNGVNGVQLWRSDGTAPGTYQVAQINSTSNSSAPSSSLTIGGTTYFTANDGIHGTELWKTDGTSAGTTMVADLNAGRFDSLPSGLTNWNGTLYFTASDGTSTNLYKTDGTAAGTSVVFAGAIRDLTPAGNYLYFEARDSSGNTDLYRTDGTPSGTQFIQILMPPLNYPFLGGPIAEPSMAAFDGTLYFTALGNAAPEGLWKVNPDAAPTEIAQLPGARGGQGNLTVVGNTLYFAANDINGNSAIWRSDGTSAGTSMVRTTGSSQYVVTNFYAFDDSLYFTVSNYYPQSVVGVYRTDGTSAGTVLLTPFNLGAAWTFTFAAAGGKLYFSSSDSSSEALLYTTDGSAAGTHVVDSTVNNISSMTAANNLLYFTGQNFLGMRELWQTDGTSTSLVNASETAAGWESGNLLGQLNNTFLFDGYDAQHGYELWGVPLTPSASSTFVKSDATTSGNWTGVYGTDGYYIIGSNGFPPSYVTLNFSDDSFYQWATYKQGDSRAPQDSPGSIYHEAGTNYASSGFSLNLNFNDGQTHQVALYLLDYDHQGRVETVQVENSDSGQVLDTRTISNFSNGQYLVYDLSGNVKITFTNGGPLNAVVSAILFDPSSGTRAITTSADAGADYTTQGHWAGIYGSEGYDVIGGSESLPGYADLSISNSQFYVWNGSTTDLRALQSSPGSSSGVAACDYSNSSSFTINLNLVDGKVHRVALYFVDYDRQNRSEMVQISDAVTGTVFTPSNVVIVGFSGGEYIRWDLSGDVKITISNDGGLNEVLSGIFFDPGPVASASFVATDSTTQGNYNGVYGQNGYDLFALTGGGAPYSSLSFPSNIQSYEWNGDTTEARVLQYPGGGSQRIAACYYSNSPSLSFNLDLTDGKTHRVALYFLDYDYQSRAETVQISNAVSGTVLDTESVSNFSQGKYLVWNLSGDLTFTISKTGGLNEVVSGILFG